MEPCRDQCKQGRCTGIERCKSEAPHKSKSKGCRLKGCQAWGPVEVEAEGRRKLRPKWRRKRQLPATNRQKLIKTIEKTKWVTYDLEHFGWFWVIVGCTENQLMLLWQVRGPFIGHKTNQSPPWNFCTLFCVCCNKRVALASADAGNYEVKTRSCRFT